MKKIRKMIFALALLTILLTGCQVKVEPLSKDEIIEGRIADLEDGLYRLERRVKALEKKKK